MKNYITSFALFSAVLLGILGQGTVAFGAEAKSKKPRVCVKFEMASKYLVCLDGKKPRLHQEFEIVDSKFGKVALVK